MSRDFSENFVRNSPWRLSLRSITCPMAFRKETSHQKSTIRSDLNFKKWIHFLHRNNIPSFLPLYSIQYSRCRWIEYKETNASNRDTTLSLFGICDFLTFARLFSRYYYRLASSELFPADKQVLPFVSECIHGFSNAQFHNSIGLGQKKKAPRLVPGRFSPWPKWFETKILV